jgi:hypothetical protein
VVVEEFGVARQNEPLVDVSWIQTDNGSMGGNSLGGSIGGSVGGSDLLNLGAQPVNDFPSAEQTPPKPAKKEGKKNSQRKMSHDHCEGRSQFGKGSRRTTSFLNLFNAVNASSSVSDKAASSAGTSQPGLSSHNRNSSTENPNGTGMVVFEISLSGIVGTLDSLS